MAAETYSSVNYLKLNPTDGSPVEFIESGDVKGQVLHCFDKFVTTEEFDTVADVVNLHGVIPKGARVLSVSLKALNSGCTTGQVSVKAGSTVILLGTADGDFGAADVATIVPYLGAKFTEESALTLYIDEVSDAFSGETIYVDVAFSMV